MDVFLGALKQRAQQRRWTWKLVPSGSRQEAFDAFRNARARPSAGEVIILLVDSEASVRAATRTDHLRRRGGDEWDLRGVPEAHIHLMVQAMEAWIVADVVALAAYYGQGFRAKVLPQRKNLEDEPKDDRARKLQAATRGTQKGEYHKIRHAADLLAKISSSKVRARCAHAEVLFAVLDRLIG